MIRICADADLRAQVLTDLHAENDPTSHQHQKASQPGHISKKAEPRGLFHSTEDGLHPRHILGGFKHMQGLSKCQIGHDVELETFRLTQVTISYRLQMLTVAQFHILTMSIASADEEAFESCSTSLAV